MAFVSPLYLVPCPSIRICRICRTCQTCLGHQSPLMHCIIHRSCMQNQPWLHIMTADVLSSLWQLTAIQWTLKATFTPYKVHSEVNLSASWLTCPICNWFDYFSGVGGSLYHQTDHVRAPFWSGSERSASVCWSFQTKHQHECNQHECNSGWIPFQQTPQMRGSCSSPQLYFLCKWWVNIQCDTRGASIIRASSSFVWFAKGSAAYSWGLLFKSLQIFYIYFVFKGENDKCNKCKIIT